jgi:glutamate racemase
MIGILDSGTGGENTLRELRRTAPTADIVFLKDIKNAPYGTKSAEELTELTHSNIDKMLSFGAESVLIACCTASCIWKYLPSNTRHKSIPIIAPTAKRAKQLSAAGQIAVISTNSTKNSHAFRNLLSDCTVTELAVQELVGFIDSGKRYGNLKAADIDYIEKLLLPLSKSCADTLILGCTHFPAIENAIMRIVRKYGIKHTVSSAKEGAGALLEQRGIGLNGNGMTVRL